MTENSELEKDSHLDTAEAVERGVRRRRTTVSRDRRMSYDQLDIAPIRRRRDEAHGEGRTPALRGRASVSMSAISKPERMK
eukprot:6214462-Pleurochrysis_carterae.AAC.8